MTEPAYEYIEARRTLLDALDALESHRDSLVLIGAQAVYLHTGSTSLSVPPMTTDADLALNTDLLADDPEIATLLHAAGFENKQQPGHWESPQGIALDLMPHGRPTPVQPSVGDGTRRQSGSAFEDRGAHRPGPGPGPDRQQTAGH